MSDDHFHITSGLMMSTHN